jgi:SagB-type dehydrogenase family enzyme
MKTIIIIEIAMLLSTTFQLPGQTEKPGKRTIDLPEPTLQSELSVEEALARRRSVRDYGKANLSLSEVGQLLWAAQGITSGGGKRTAPSAGALYPLEIFVVAGHVEGLAAGVYQYQPHNHKLRLEKEGDVRRELAFQAVSQEWIAEAPAVLVIAGVYERTMSKYGERGQRYVHMEVGYASQNVYLQAETLGLATCAVGAFQDGNVRELLGLRRRERPLLLMPVGKK